MVACSLASYSAQPLPRTAFPVLPLAPVASSAHLSNYRPLRVLAAASAPAPATLVATGTTTLRSLACVGCPVAVAWLLLPVVADRLQLQVQLPCAMVQSKQVAVASAAALCLAALFAVPTITPIVPASCVSCNPTITHFSQVIPGTSRSEPCNSSELLGKKV